MAPTLKYSISYGTNLPKRHQPWNILFFMTPILILFNFLMTPIYLKDTNPDSFHFLDGTNLPKRHQPRFIPFSMTPTCLKDTNPNLFHFTMAPTCLKDTKPDLFFWMAKNEKWIKSRLVSFRQVGAIPKLNKIGVGRWCLLGRLVPFKNWIKLWLVSFRKVGAIKKWIKSGLVSFRQVGATQKIE